MSLLDKPIWFEINSSVARLGESLHQLINNMLALGDVPEDLETHIKSFSEEADRLRQSVAEHAHDDRFPQVMVSDETGKRPYYVKGGMILEKVRKKSQINSKALKSFLGAKSQIIETVK